MIDEIGRPHARLRAIAGLAHAAFGLQRVAGAGAMSLLCTADVAPHGHSEGGNDD